MANSPGPPALHRTFVAPARHRTGARVL